MCSVLSDTALFILQGPSESARAWLPPWEDHPSSGEMGAMEGSGAGHREGLQISGLCADPIRHSPGCSCCALASEPGDQLLTASPDGLPELGERAAPTQALGRPQAPVSPHIPPRPRARPRSQSEAHPHLLLSIASSACVGDSWGTGGGHYGRDTEKPPGGWGGTRGSPRGAGRSSLLRISLYSSSACWYLFCFR